MNDDGLRDLAPHLPGLKRLAQSILKDEASGDDVLQEVWLASSAAARGTVDNRASWLAGITRNLAKGELRDRARRAVREQIAAPHESLDADPARVAERDDTRQRLLRAVEDLGEPYGSTLRERYFEGLSAVEIGRRHGRPAATVRTHLQRGLEQLRASLAPEFGDGRALGVALVGAFRWEKSEVLQLGAAGSAATAGVGLLLWSKVLGAVALLALGLGLYGLMPFGKAKARGPQSPLTVARAALGEVGAGASGSELQAAESTATLRQPGSERIAPGPESALEPPGEGQSAMRRGPTLQVLDEFGVPVPDAQVKVLIPGGSFPLGPGDRYGKFAVDLGLDFGQARTLSPDGEGVLVVATAEQQAQSHAYLLRLDRQATETLVLRLRGPGITIEGRVLDEGGRPLAGREVQINESNVAATSSNGRGAAFTFGKQGETLRSVIPTTVTDEQGEFELSGLLPGIHALVVVSPDHRPETILVDGREGSPPPCELRLRQGASLVVRVVDEVGQAVAGAAVVVEPSQSLSELRRGTSGSDGRCVFDRLELGETRVQASADGRWAETKTPVLARQAAEVVLALGSGSSFQVQLVENGLSPVAGLEVRAATRFGRWSVRDLRSDQDGRVALTDFPQEELRVLVFAEDVVFPLASAVVLPEAGRTIRLECPREHSSLGSVSGALRIGGKALPPNSRISLTELTMGTTLDRLIEAEGGGFRFERVPPGAYELVLATPDWGLHVLKAVQLEGDSLDLGGMDLAPTGTLRVENGWPVGQGGAHRLAQTVMHGGGLGAGTTTLAEGSGPPLAEWSLLPGLYHMDLMSAEGEHIQSNSVYVRSEHVQVLPLGPARSSVAIVSLQVKDLPRLPIKVELHGLEGMADGDLEAMDSAALGELLKDQTLVSAEQSEPGWMGVYALDWPIDPALRWVVSVSYGELPAFQGLLVRPHVGMPSTANLALSAEGWQFQAF